MVTRSIQSAAGAIAIALSVAACAPALSTLGPRAQAQARQLVEGETRARTVAEGGLEERSEDVIRTRVVQPSAEAGDVSLRAVNTPIGPLLAELARAHAYSLAIGDGVQAARLVSVELADLSPEAALRRVALAGGLVAVVDRTAKSVSVVERASYTYRVPLHVMQRLQAAFTVGGNPVAGTAPTAAATGPQASFGGAGGTGGTGGGANGGLQASFTVSGRYQTDAQGVAGLIQHLAGKNAEVQVMADLGLISVRSNAVALARVSNFLNKFSANAMRRVEIEASIVEVTLTEDFQYGIQWSKVLGGQITGNARLGDLSLLTKAASADVSLASAGISSILRALQAFTTVRVISQPKVMAMNNTPSVIFDGQQLPYLGSVASTTTPSGAAASTTTSGTASYAVDGVTLSIQPDILSDTEVQLTIVPVLSRVQEFQNFDLGGGARITAPVQRSNQSLMQVVAEHGKTLIMGGIRSSSGTHQSSGLPGLAGATGLASLFNARAVADTAREVVILLRARVIPGGAYDALFSEAI